MQKDEKSPAPDHEEEYITAQMAADLLGVTKGRVFDLIQSERFTPYILLNGRIVERTEPMSNRDVFVRRKQVQEYAASRRRTRAKKSE